MIVEYQEQVLEVLGRSAIEAAKAHAIAEFPKESCGFIKGGAYFACANKHKTPLTHFTIRSKRYDKAYAAGEVAAIVHSHPNGPLSPSHADMQQQDVSDVPWVIITLNETGVDKIVAWGDSLPVPQLIGRPFIHGVLDCYTVVRDVFRLGSDALLQQGIHWPLAPILLPQVPRGDGWWTESEDLYAKQFEQFGFRKINFAEVQPGDCFLAAVGNKVINPKRQLNHAGVLLHHDQVLHHMPTDISRRVQCGVWGRSADLWIRYEGPER